MGINVFVRMCCAQVGGKEDECVLTNGQCRLVNELAEIGICCEVCSVFVSC